VSGSIKTKFIQDEKKLPNPRNFKQDIAVYLSFHASSSLFDL